MPTFFFRLLLGAHSMCQGRQRASGAARFSSSLDGCIPHRLLLLDRERQDRENTHGCQPQPLLHRRSARACVSRCQAARTDGLCELRAQRSWSWIPHQLVMDGGWSRDSANPKTRRCSEAAGAGMSPHSAPFHWNRNI